MRTIEWAGRQGERYKGWYEWVIPVITRVVTFFGSSAVHGFSISADKTFANSLWDSFFLSYFKAVDGIIQYVGYKNNSFWTSCNPFAILEGVEIKKTPLQVRYEIILRIIRSETLFDR